MSSGSPVLKLIDFFDQIAKGHEKARQNIAVCATYFVFALVSGVVAKHFSDMDFSAVLTAGAAVQCFGFYLLLQKAHSTHSVAGISSKTLELYVLAFAFRLPCTCLRNGYLPVDQSGDWVYQSADVMSVFLVLHLLYVTHKTYGTTYQAAHDSLDIFKAIPACAVLAFFVKGDLNSSPFFDWVWTTSLLLDTIAMLPQIGRASCRERV